MQVSANNLTESQVQSSLQDSIASQLGVNPEDVVVEYDSETQNVTYTITSDNVESLVAANQTMAQPDLVLTNDSALTVNYITTPDTIVATTNGTSNADGNLLIQKLFILM